MPNQRTRILILSGMLPLVFAWSSNSTMLWAQASPPDPPTKSDSATDRSATQQRDQPETEQENKQKKPHSRRFFIGNDKGIKKGGVVYSQGKGNDGEKYELKCDLYIPNGEGPFPAIVAVHGGAWRAGAKWHMMRHAWKFLEDGYVVVAINYRHAPKHQFPAQIHDLKQAVRWMRFHAKEYKMDPENIVAFGYSAGGHLVSLLGTTDQDDGLEGPVDKKYEGISTRVKAVVAGGPPCEFSWVGKNSRALNYWMGHTRSRKPELWKSASPVEFVTTDDPPFWLFHAKDDNVVPPSSSEKMLAVLQKTGVTSSRKVYPGYGHFSMFSNLETVDEALKFFNKTLKRTSGKTTIDDSHSPKKKSPAE